MRTKIVLQSVLVLAALLGEYFSQELIRAVSFPMSLLPQNPYLRDIAWKALNYAPILLVTGVLFWRQLPYLLGLKHSLVRSFGIALLFTLPMFLSFPFFFEWNGALDGLTVYRGAFTAAVFEELAFRALVFGALYYGCGWRFLPAALPPAIVFGLEHLYQASDATSAALTVLFMFSCALWVTWLYVKWGNNLYLAIFLHLLMNFSWMLFSVSDDALGGLAANMARLATFIVSVGVTLYFTGHQLPAKAALETDETAAHEKAFA
ncbi:lysostaphin resistance A-like protein [Pontibacter sp. MBLB2868]|uniref:CPBP family intramembrane glutamic endopeptidase n=1 Tax=Pontibacter sp. MBLB2868 TaxID=3451555 RepID=UPI003F75686B